MNTSRFSRIAPRLLAGTGLTALLGAGAIVSSRPAHSTGGPVPVTETSPVTTLAGDGIGKQPFAATINISIASGASGGTDNGNVTPGTQTVAVPAGKRLVVQMVSVYRSRSLTAGSGVQIFLNGNVNGGYASYAMPSAIANGATYAGASQAMTFVADAGTEVLANAFRTVTTGAETDTVTVSGYLVNVP